jgi:hypothetical protein
MGSRKGAWSEQQAERTEVRFSIPQPERMRVWHFQLEGEDYALLSFPLPEPALPANLTPAEKEIVNAAIVTFGTRH